MLIVLSFYTFALYSSNTNHYYVLTIAPLLYTIYSNISSNSHTPPLPKGCVSSSATIRRMCSTPTLWRSSILGTSAISTRWRLTCKVGCTHTDTQTHVRTVVCMHMHTFTVLHVLNTIRMFLRTHMRAVLCLSVCVCEFHYILSKLVQSLMFTSPLPLPLPLSSPAPPPVGRGAHAVLL